MRVRFYLTIAELFGTNSTFKLMFKPSASLCSNFKVGFADPFSILLMSDCAIPVASDNCFCVTLLDFLASIRELIISYSGSRASYSFLKDSSLSCSFYASVNVILYLRFLDAFSCNLLCNSLLLLFLQEAFSVFSS